MLQQECCRRADEDAEKVTPKRAALLLLFLLQINVIIRPEIGNHNALRGDISSCFCQW